MTTLRSRILEFIEPKVMKELHNICRSTETSDNNVKADKVLQVLQQYNKDFVELGPGTNRLAVLIDNYVFKIALDKWGVQDNWNEFTMTQELQPYVIKVYECNGLIAVTEYVTVISREEFEGKKEEIRKILGILAESYLLGDVGTVPRNFLNWGYRDNGDLVILDFAYIYRVKGEEMLCENCKEIVDYDENFHNLICRKCGKKYKFTDLRRRITMDDENKEIFMAKELAYKLTQPLQEIKDKYEEESSESENKNTVNSKEDMYMDTNYLKNDYDSKEGYDAYLEALDMLGRTNTIEEEPDRNEKEKIRIISDIEVPDAFIEGVETETSEIETDIPDRIEEGIREIESGSVFAQTDEGSAEEAAKEYLKVMENLNTVEAENTAEIETETVNEVEEETAEPEATESEATELKDESVNSCETKQPAVIVVNESIPEPEKVTTPNIIYPEDDQASNIKVIKAGNPVDGATIVPETEAINVVAKEEEQAPVTVEEKECEPSETEPARVFHFNNTEEDSESEGDEDYDEEESDLENDEEAVRKLREELGDLAESFDDSGMEE